MDNLILRKKICDKYGTVRKFSKKVGFTESAVCKMLRGSRKIFPYSRDSFAEVLDIPQKDYEMYFGKEIV